MQKRLVVVGSINMDLVAATERIPLAGETVFGTSFRTFPGGKGANQAFAAARLRAPVSMIAKVGNDAFGPELRASLDASGVDTRAVGVAATSSGLAQITTAANGENAIVVVGGANSHLSPRDLDEHLDLIRQTGLTQHGSQRVAIGQVVEGGVDLASHQNRILVHHQKRVAQEGLGLRIFGGIRRQQVMQIKG